MSLVPGLAHLVQGRFGEIVFFFIGWLVALAVAVYMYGTTAGTVLLGLAIALHGWIAVQHGLMKEFKDVGERIFLMSFVLISLALFYWGVRMVIFPNLTGGYTSLTIPKVNIEHGDYLLAWSDEVTPEHLTRGSLALIRIGRDRVRGRGVVVRYRRGSMVGQIIGVPGDMVEVRKQLYVVNGEPLDADTYPLPPWLRGMTLFAKIKAETYFISSEYDVRIQGAAQVPEAQILELCVVDIEDIEGRAFMRWLPISRRGYIEEIE